jgi:ABC-2 type transport system permease protein
MLAFLFAMLFNAGEILDRERQRATLTNLFLAPCPRYTWLGGMQLFALAEAGFAAIVALLAGWWIFGLPFDINFPALIVALVLFVPCLWGFSMIFGAIGVAIRGANMLSNFVFPFLMVLSGAIYPVSKLPDWLRVPARLLPFGYGIQAIADALTRGTSIVAMRAELLPLLVFAIVLPALGIIMFNWLEHRARQTGELDLL